MKQNPACDAVYGRVFRTIERAMHPNDFPAVPDPRAVQAALGIYRRLGLWSTPPQAAAEVVRAVPQVTDTEVLPREEGA